MRKIILFGDIFRRKRKIYLKGVLLNRENSPLNGPEKLENNYTVIDS